jgi:hypothetical protein
MRLAVRGWLLVLALVPGTPLALSASSASPSTTPCTLVSVASTLTCYPPASIVRILPQLRGAAIDPSPAVARVTGLPLTQLATSRRLLPTPSTRVTALTFVYGQLPPSGGPEDPSPAMPKWLLIDEHPGRLRGVHGVTVSRAISIGNVTPTPTTPPLVHIWTMFENLPYRCLNITAESNENKGVMRSLGQMLQEMAARHRQTRVGAPRC